MKKDHRFVVFDLIEKKRNDKFICKISYILELNILVYVKIFVFKPKPCYYIYYIFN